MSLLALAGRGRVAVSSQLIPVFFSDFSNALGTGASALGDGGKWDIVSSYGSIVSTAGLDFPSNMANCFRVPWDSAGIATSRKTGMSIPAIGTTRNYRWYFRHVQPNATLDTKTHPIQDGNPGSQTNWAFALYNNVGNDVWRPSLQAAQNETWPLNNWLCTSTLPKGQTYRFELALTRLDATTFNMAVWYYNSAGTLVLDSSDFRDANDNEESLLLSSNPTFTFFNVNNLDGLNCGCEENQPAEPGDYAYEGGFAVCDNQGAIGPYGSVLGEVAS